MTPAKVRPTPIVDITPTTRAAHWRFGDTPRLTVFRGFRAVACWSLWPMGFVRRP